MNAPAGATLSNSNDTSGSGAWEYFDLEALFKDEVERMRKLLTKEVEKSEEGEGLGGAGTLTWHPDAYYSRAKDWAEQLALQNIETIFDNRDRVFVSESNKASTSDNKIEIELEEKCVLSYAPPPADRLTVRPIDGKENEFFQYGKDWIVRGKALWVRF